MLANFNPVFPMKPQQQQHQNDILKTFTASTVMECLLRCSRMTECKSVAIKGINIGGSSGGYCQLYKAPFKQSMEHHWEHHWKDTQYYNKNNEPQKDL